MKTFGPLPEKLAVNYVEKMLDGLQYLHERGVVHCDLKVGSEQRSETGGFLTNMTLHSVQTF